MSVVGVVTAEAGRLGTPPLIAIQDGSAGIAVRISEDDPRPPRGARVAVTGSLADPYGQLEIRNLVGGLHALGTAALPAPLGADAATIDDDIEARLVSVTGTADSRPSRATSGDLAFTLSTARGPLRILADASSGIAPTSIAAGDRLRLTGVVGQRASRKGAADGFRVWLRDSGDIVRLSAGGSSPSSTPQPTGSAATGSVIAIATAILAGSGDATVEGVVTTRSTLLDATGRRIVIQDRTAAIEVLLPAGSTAPAVGMRIRVTGDVGRAYGAPRIKASQIARLGRGSVGVLELRTAPTAGHEWRLVRVRGDVVDLHRSGDRWQAELLVGGRRIPIVGLAGAGIPSAALDEGRTVTIIGIVRRPYPSATDRRFAIVPRSGRDVTIGGAADDASTAGGTTAASAGAGAGLGGAAGSSTGGELAGAIDIDLVAIDEHVGDLVRAGGLVASVDPDGFDLDDGTALGRIVVHGAAGPELSTIATGDALGVVGRVERATDGTVVIAIEDPAGITRVGDPIAGDPSAATTASGPAGSAGPELDREPVAAAVADPLAPEIGLAGIVLVGVASVAVTLLRRQRSQRLLAARVRARLDDLVRPVAGAGPEGPPDGLRQA